MHKFTDVTPSLPLVDAQPTSGQRLNIGELTSDGRIPINYGDDGANTGAISVLLWDPITGEVENVLPDQPTEMFRHHRTFADGSSWTTSEDPKGGGPNNNRGFLCTNRGGAWHRVTVDIPGLTVVVHMHDSQEVDGVISIVGSRDTLPSENGGVRPDDEGTAIVWDSADGGATWTEEVAFHGNGLSEYNRFFSIGRVDDSLVVFTNGFQQPELVHGYYTKIDGVWSSKKLDYTAPSTMYQNMIYGPGFFYRATPYAKMTLNNEGRLAILASEPDGAKALALSGDRFTYLNTSGETVDSVLGAIERSAQSVVYGPNDEFYMVWNLTRIIKVEPKDA